MISCTSRIPSTLNRTPNRHASVAAMPASIDQNAPCPVPQRRYSPPNTAGKKPAANTAPEKLVSSTTPAGGNNVTKPTTPL